MHKATNDVDGASQQVNGEKAFSILFFMQLKLK